MKLLIATPLYPPQIGGPATYAALLARELPRYGHEARVVSFGSVRALPPGVRHALYLGKLIAALLKASDIDTVFALDPFSVGVPALIAARIMGKRFAIKIVGDFAWEQYVQHGGKNGRVMLEDFQDAKLSARFSLYRSLERLVAKSADRVIVPSGYLKEIIARWGVAPPRLSVVYNAFDPPEKVPAREEARHKRRLSGRVIVSAGRLVPWKGFSELVDAVAELRQELPDATLIIAGDGPLREALAKHIRLRGLEKSVRLVGQCEQKMLHELVIAADVFVLASTYEGFSHVLLEAASLGTPLVATKVGGNGELITEGQTGLLVPPGERAALLQALRDVFAHPEEARARAARAQGLVLASFSTNRMISETVSLLSRA